MYFLLQQADINKYTIIIILYYLFMIECPTEASVLQCYNVNNVTASASEPRVKAFLSEPHPIWDKTPRRFQKLFILPPIIGTLVERQPTEFFPNFVMSMK